MRVGIGVAQDADPGTAAVRAVAQRLESNATPGHILAAEAVYEAARDLFAEAERKELSVKGRAQAVVAYECRPA